jgi:hypothetical protein
MTAGHSMPADMPIESFQNLTLWDYTRLATQTVNATDQTHDAHNAHFSKMAAFLR